MKMEFTQRLPSIPAIAVRSEQIPEYSEAIPEAEN
jgi:hypothetical protein